MRNSQKLPNRLLLLLGFFSGRTKEYSDGQSAFFISSLLCIRRFQTGSYQGSWEEANDQHLGFMLLLLCVVAPRATLYFAPVGWNSHSVSPCPISWCRFGVRWRFKPRRLISRSFASFRSFDAAAEAVRIHHQQPAQWNATRCWGQQQQQPGVVWTGKHRLLLQSLFHIWGKIIHHFTQHAMLYNWLYSSSSSDSLSNCVCTGKRVRKHPTILELQAGPPVISLFLFAQLSSPDYSSSFLYTQTRWQPFELCRFFPFFFISSSKWWWWSSCQKSSEVL